VLKGITIDIQARQHIAICGRTGSGKTSLILCLLKMISVKDGTVAIDGVDISTLSPSILRSRINVYVAIHTHLHSTGELIQSRIPQDPFLIPGTIRFNIDPQLTVSDDDIIRALNRVGLWTIIEAQGGLDADLDATTWSAGQKQLLCFARAMVKQSRILILDESMSR
jgi:ATP-binding cassette subfamily C (CFTR/MRP) protein 1